MAYFPRKGYELSEECEVRFGKAKIQRPSIVHRYENKSSSARFATGKAIHTFAISFAGAEDNFGTVTDFFDTHGNVVPFTLVHPHYGVGTAKFVDDNIEPDPIVHGNPPWFRIEMQVEAVF